MRDENMSWIRENLTRSKGIIIIPSLLKGGFILGGSGGSGVLVARDEKSGEWSQPGFYTIGSVSFGLQIGGEAAEVIMVVRSQRGLEKLLATSVKLGGDTSIAAGPVGGGAKTNVTADIVSFSRSKGAYAGLSLEGAVVKTRDKWTEAYYGKPVRPVDIFVKHSVYNSGSTELRNAIAGAEGKEAGPSRGSGRFHVVKQGDTLYGISKKYNISVDELCRLNDIEKSSSIYPGQKIRVSPEQ
jgi:lipid-binding SYLF domain-containing protein